MDIGAFILGILFGWLVEWIYVNFFGSKSSEGLSDCSAYERELNTRNDEIKALKAQLGVTSGAGASLMSKSQDATVTASDSVTNAGSTSGATTAKKETKPAKAAGSTKATASKAKTPATNKVAAKKSASSAKPVVAKSMAKKPAAKKKKTATKTNTGKKQSGDDFTKLTGIGPSMAAKLKELDIATFEKLAAMDDDILRDMLEASGARLNNNKEDMDTWNEQATLAAKGDFDGLKLFQEKLKK